MWSSLVSSSRTPDCAHSSRSSSALSYRKNVPPKRKNIQRQYGQVDAERLELEKKKVQILKETSATDRQFVLNAINADYNFLMSVLPFIEPFIFREKLDLRVKLQKDVNDAYKKYEQM